VIDLHTDLVARFLVTAFFAVVFLQSALDKLFDRAGNLAYFGDHFKGSPVVELSAGGLCVLGLVSGDFRTRGFGIAAGGVALAGAALLCLITGQRLAKDYAGAAVVAAYFAVALVGLLFF